MQPEDRERLVRVETKLDTIITSGGDHEKRIRSLERGWWKQMGAMGVITVIAAKYAPLFRIG